MTTLFKQLLEQRENELPALTGVRFLGVSMVFLKHYNEKEKFGNIGYFIFDQFYLSLNIFFVLSGFLICYMYYEKAELSKKFLGVFFVKRIARVFPLYFLLTTLFFIVYYINGEREHWLGFYLLNITYLKGFSSWFMFTGIYPAWSLTVEETFYVLAPFIFLLIKKRNILFGQILFFWLIGGILLLIFSYFPFKGFFKDFHFISWATFFGRCFEFFAGIWLAVRIRKIPVNNLLQQKRTAPYTWFGLAGMFAVIIYLGYFPEETAQGWMELLHFQFMRGIIFAVMVTIFFYGLLREKSIVRQLLSTRLVTLLGRSSYAFFLIHTGVIASWVYDYISPTIVGMYFFIYVLSILLFAFVEEPLRELVNRWGMSLVRKKQVT